jgi:hypothetical protein
MKYGKMGEHACGKSYLVRCTGATNQAPQPCKGDEIVVKTVDYCPPGYRGTINMLSLILLTPMLEQLRLNMNCKLSSRAQN